MASRSVGDLICTGKLGSESAYSLPEHAWFSESSLCFLEENGKFFHVFLNFGGCFFICVEVATVGVIYSPREHQFVAQVWKTFLQIVVDIIGHWNNVIEIVDVHVI